MEKKDVFIAVLQPEDESARQRAELLRKYVMPHKNLIYSICIKYTYNQEDIEDNYLEALANFFKYMDSYDPARPVKTWIYAVTKRLVAGPEQPQQEPHAPGRQYRHFGNILFAVG